MFELSEVFGGVDIGEGIDLLCVLVLRGEVAVAGILVFEPSPHAVVFFFNQPASKRIALIDVPQAEGGLFIAIIGWAHQLTRLVAGAIVFELG